MRGPLPLASWEERWEKRVAARAARVHPFSPEPDPTVMTATSALAAAPPVPTFREVAPPSDYATVRGAIEFISREYRTQPSLEEVAEGVGAPPAELEAALRRWAGLSPKAFLQAVTLDHARRLLAEGLPLLDAAFEVGLSGPSRLHDLFVKHEAMSPGAHKAKGEGLELGYGFADGPFGRSLAIWTERGLAGLAFSDEERGGRRGRPDRPRHLLPAPAGAGFVGECPRQIGDRPVSGA